MKVLLCAAVVVVLAVIAVPAAMGHKDPGGPVVGGLFNPRGIDAAGGRLFVAETGSGEITKIRLKGKNAPNVSTIATLPTLPGGPMDDPPALGPVEVAVSGSGKKYVLMSGPPRGPTGDEFGRLVQVRRDGTTRLIADIADYQEGDPDPDDLEGLPSESNPNGLALLHGGKFLVADAANNDLLLVDSKRHRITTVARFKPSIVPWPSGLPFGPPPGTPVPAEAVPTTVAVGPDGAWYVSQLLGFPFTKGAAHVYRIKPWSVGATCDPAAPNSRCRSIAGGFTNVIDLAFGRHGTMYVLEIAKNSLLDAGLGALWRVKHGVKTELAPGQLLFPGGVAVGHHGDLFVTTGTVFGPGAGGVVRVPD